MSGRLVPPASEEKEQLPEAFINTFYYLHGLQEMMQISEKMNNKLPIDLRSGKRMSKMLFLTLTSIRKPKISAKEGQQATPMDWHLAWG